MDDKSWIARHAQHSRLIPHLVLRIIRKVINQDQFVKITKVAVPLRKHSHYPAVLLNHSAKQCGEVF